MKIRALDLVIGFQHFKHFLAILKISFKLKVKVSLFATKDVLDVISGIWADREPKYVVFGFKR